MTEPEGVAATEAAVTKALDAMPRAYAVNLCVGAVVDVLESGQLNLMDGALRVLDRYDPFMGARVRGNLAHLIAGDMSMSVRAWAMKHLSYNPIMGPVPDGRADG